MKVNDITSGTSDLYEMANLYPQDTGLPMTVWVSPRGRARHDARVKVSIAHGPRMQARNTAVVSVRPTPALIAGTLSQSDLTLVSRWISLNADALIGYWNGTLSTAQLIHALQRI